MEFKRLSLVSPHYSKLHCNCSHEGGEGQESNPGPFACLAQVVPTVPHPQPVIMIVFFSLSAEGVEPRALRVQGKNHTTELHS